MNQEKNEIFISNAEEKKNWDFSSFKRTTNVLKRKKNF